MKIERMMRILGALACALALPAALAAAIDGRVLSEGGTPVEHARVEAGEGGEVAFSDNRGGFRLDSVDAPADLYVTHPRFVTGHVQVAAESAEALEIRLLAPILNRLRFFHYPGEPIVVNQKQSIIAKHSPGFAQELVSVEPMERQGGRNDRHRIAWKGYRFGARLNVSNTLISNRVRQHVPGDI